MFQLAYWNMKVFKERSVSYEEEDESGVKFYVIDINSIHLHFCLYTLHYSRPKSPVYTSGQKPTNNSTFF